MILAMALFGVCCGPAFAHVSMLFATEGYEAMTVAVLLSVQGAALTAGKLFFGQLADMMGTRKASFLLYAMDVVGCLLLCFSGLGLPAAGTGVLLLGLGTPLSTVGAPLFAADLEYPDKFASALRNYNIAISGGSMVFGLLPGVIADAAGSYAPFYTFAALCAGGSMLLVFLSYREVRRALRQRGPEIKEPLSK